MIKTVGKKDGIASLSQQTRQWDTICQGEVVPHYHGCHTGGITAHCAPRRRKPKSQCQLSLSGERVLALSAMLLRHESWHSRNATHSAVRRDPTSERPSGPTRHAPSGLVVLPSILVSLTLEDTDVNTLEPTPMKIKMISPSGANTAPGYPSNLPAAVHLRSAGPVADAASTCKRTADRYAAFPYQPFHKDKFVSAEVYILH